MGAQSPKQPHEVDEGQPVLRPGDIYSIPLDHPVIVISREELNRGDYVLVVPVTSGKFESRKDLENCVPFSPGEFGFEKHCVAQAEMVSWLFKTDLDLEHGRMGRLTDEALGEVVEAVGYVMGAKCRLNPPEKTEAQSPAAMG